MSEHNSATRWYRADITGLRTLAIVPVVAFHAGASFLPGGFVGVDIFYVISGFLITTLLVREATKNGRIQFGTFWAKRIRRLVPVLVLVVAVTLPVSMLFSSVLGWDTLAAEGVASVLYLSNFLYWRQSTNYFSDAASLNPLLHTWSLSVEEQFYVLWPIAIALVWFIARRSSRVSAVPLLAIVMGAVFVASLVCSVLLTPRDPSAAFYLLPTRAWEFAAGALLALAPLHRVLARRGAGISASLVGVALIGWSLLFIHEEQPFPGSIALVPVAGTLLVIAGGSASQTNLINRALSTRPFVWFGEISYSWYLWHWPFIVISVAAFGSDAWWIKVLAAIASLGAAALSYPLVEKRFRFAPSMTRSVRRTYLVGTIATGSVVVLALGVFAAGSVATKSEPLKTYAETAAAFPDQRCISEEASPSGVEVCKMGDTSSNKVIMLVGDSHAGQWKAAMSEAASRQGIELVVRWKSSCPALVVNVAAEGEMPDAACQSFQRDTKKLITELHPSAVVISNAFGYVGKTRDGAGAEIPVDQQLSIWSAAYEDYIGTVRDAGSEVAFVNDNPRIPFDPIECLTTFGATPESCSVPVSSATADIQQIADVQASEIERLGIQHTFSVGADICGETDCKVVDDTGLPIYLDGTHLAKEWTMRYVPQLEDWLASLSEQSNA